MERPNAWKTYNKTELKKVEALAAEYRTFIDNGVPFNPLEQAEPDIHATAEERKIGGLGIYMVKKN